MFALLGTLNHINCVHIRVALHSLGISFVMQGVRHATELKLGLCWSLVNPVALGGAAANGNTARFQTCQRFRMNPI